MTRRQVSRNSKRAARHRALLDKTLPNPFIPPVKKPAAKKKRRRRP